MSLAAPHLAVSSHCRAGHSGGAGRKGWTQDVSFYTDCGQRQLLSCGRARGGLCVQSPEKQDGAGGLQVRACAGVSTGLCPGGQVSGERD